MAAGTGSVSRESGIDRPVFPRELRSATLIQELLELLARNSRRVPIPVLLATGLIAAVVFDSMRSPLPFLWLGCVAAFLVVRYAILGKLPGRVQISEQKRVRTAILLSGINGTIHATCLVFFPLISEFDRLLVTILVLALSAGAVGSTVGFRPVFLAYLTPMLLPLSLVWVINPGAVTGWRELFVALLIVLFGLLLVALARDAFRLFRESFEIRLQHVDLNRRLEKALEESRVANEAKTRFLAAASHDLRQPVHAMSLFSAALSHRPLDPQTREIADHVASALDVLSLQLEALLDVSKLDAGVTVPDVSSFRLATVLERLREQFSPLADEKDLSLKISCEPDMMVRTDEMLLEQIIRNLLSNAIKNTDEGTVSVTAARSRQNIRVKIADTGRGIPESARQRVFEEFYQVDNPGRDRSRGLGLGLAIVKRLVALLEIPFDMESVVGQGTVVRLSLTPAASVATVIDDDIEQFDLAGLKVLVIDDETEVRKGMESLLIEFGCDVSLATDAAEAARAVTTSRPDLVLCDLRLQNAESGLDVIRDLKTIAEGVPAILLTGDTGADKLREVHDSQLIVLHKPVRLDDLRNAIARVFHEPKEGERC